MADASRRRSASATAPSVHDPALATICVVGVTDAGAASLTAEARALVERASVLVGGERHLAFFPDCGDERIVLKANIDEVVERLRGESRPTVVLASGDPDCFGIGPLLAERLGRYRVRILPNVGAAQLACARLGIAWEDAALLSAHGRPLDAILPRALRARTAIVFTDSRNSPSAIAEALLAAGDADVRVDVFEHLGGPLERHVCGLLSEIRGQQFAPLNLMVLRREATPPPWPIGIHEDRFLHRGGLISKPEVRAISLSKLVLHERATLWDVGAGCGSVSIVAAALLPHGHVYAVERDGEQLALLEQNRRRFGAGNVAMVHGEAPAALGALPRPDSVFVGGSGGRLEAILDAVALALAAGGRVVANLVALEHLEQARRWAAAHGWDAEIVEVSVARSTVTAGITRLEARNPVFVVTLQRVAEGAAR
ncbi:MAG TPA: precorrin-6y C5,15-methyltransferase (decarboxylating) subunit CbiE [Chloroflexota bacterium]|nr:precorrin-6y C5,15-methyltransferase (decarboxylating) subunit CbiE [Chloroflexota bacterium]